ncbi:MAG TPA: DciA family protein [Gammaproteobacteria bacterium]|nr:DciA family protein [Gammaproteobacteria bacterium]
MKYPKAVGKLLIEEGGDLRRLLDHAQRLQQATRIVHEGLSPPLNEHCRVANIKDSMLVLHADSPAWAAKLRFQVAAMLAQLNRAPGFGELRSIRVKVCPQARVQPEVVSKPRSLSPRVAALISSVAETSTDPALKEVLLRLSKRRF